MHHVSSGLSHVWFLFLVSRVCLHLFSLQLQLLEVCCTPPKTRLYTCTHLKTGRPLSAPHGPPETCVPGPSLTFHHIGHNRGRVFSRVSHVCHMTREQGAKLLLLSGHQDRGRLLRVLLVLGGLLIWPVTDTPSYVTWYLVLLNAPFKKEMKIILSTVRFIGWREDLFKEGFLHWRHRLLMAAVQLLVP